MSTQYVPTKGAVQGPEFPSMTGANLWIINQTVPSEWIVKLLRKPFVSAEGAVSHFATHQHLGGANNEA